MQWQFQFNSPKSLDYVLFYGNTFSKGGGGESLTGKCEQGMVFFFLIQDDQNFGQELQN